MTVSTDRYCNEGAADGGGSASKPWWKRNANRRRRKNEKEAVSERLKSPPIIPATATTESNRKRSKRSAADETVKNGDDNKHRNWWSDSRSWRGRRKKNHQSDQSSWAQAQNEVPVEQAADDKAESKSNSNSHTSSNRNQTPTTAGENLKVIAKSDSSTRRKNPTCAIKTGNSSSTSTITSSPARSDSSESVLSSVETRSTTCSNSVSGTSTPSRPSTPSDSPCGSPRLMGSDSIAVDNALLPSLAHTATAHTTAGTPNSIQISMARPIVGTVHRCRPTRRPTVRPVSTSGRGGRVIRGRSRRGKIGGTKKRLAKRHRNSHLLVAADRKRKLKGRIRGCAPGRNTKRRFNESAMNPAHASVLDSANFCGWPPAISPTDKKILNLMLARNADSNWHCNSSSSSSSRNYRNDGSVSNGATSGVIAASDHAGAGGRAAGSSRGTAGGGSRGARNSGNERNDRNTEGQHNAAGTSGGNSEESGGNSNPNASSTAAAAAQRSSPAQQKTYSISALINRFEQNINRREYPARRYLKEGGHQRAAPRFNPPSRGGSQETYKNRSQHEGGTVSVKAVSEQNSIIERDSPEEGVLLPEYGNTVTEEKIGTDPKSTENTTHQNSKAHSKEAAGADQAAAQKAEKERAERRERKRKKREKIKALTGRTNRGDREEDGPEGGDSSGSDDSSDLAEDDPNNLQNSRSSHRRSQSHLTNTTFLSESAAYALRCSEMTRQHNNREECLRRVIQAQKHVNEKQRDERNKLMQEVKRVQTTASDVSSLLLQKTETTEEEAKEVDTQRAEMVAERKKWAREKSSFAIEIDQLRNQVAVVEIDKNALADAQAATKKLELELKSLRTEKTDLSTQLQFAETKAEHKYDADVSKLQKEIAELKQKVAGHESERTRFAEAKDKTISQLQTELQEQKEKTKTAEEELERLKSEVQNNDSLSVTGRSKTSSLNVSVSGGNGGMATLAMGRGTVGTKISTASSPLDELNSSGRRISRSGSKESFGRGMTDSLDEDADGTPSKRRSLTSMLAEEENLKGRMTACRISPPIPQLANAKAHEMQYQEKINIGQSSWVRDMEGGTSKKDSNTLKVPGSGEPQKRTTTFKNLLDNDGKDEQKPLPSDSSQAETTYDTDPELKKSIFRAVCRDDVPELEKLMKDIPTQEWLSFRNAAGDSLLKVADVRKRTQTLHCMRKKMGVAALNCGEDIRAGSNVWVQIDNQILSQAGSNVWVFRRVGDLVPEQAKVLSLHRDGDGEEVETSLNDSNMTAKVEFWDQRIADEVVPVTRVRLMLQRQDLEE